jgi:hypothetical protein
MVHHKYDRVSQPRKVYCKGFKFKKNVKVNIHTKCTAGLWYQNLVTTIGIVLVLTDVPPCLGASTCSYQGIMHQMSVCPVHRGINFAPPFFTCTLASEENHWKPQAVWPKSARHNLFSKCGHPLWAHFIGLLFPVAFSQGFRRLWAPLLKTSALQIAKFPEPAKFESKPSISALMC